MANNTMLLDEANIAVSIVNPLILKALIALVIFFIGFIIGKIAEKLVLKIFEISDLDRLFRKRTGIRIKPSLVVASIVSYFIYIVAIVMALNRLEIATPAIATVVIVLVVVLILFLIFGLNDLFSNLSAGLFVRIRKSINAGDYIRIKDKHIEGYVVSVNALNIRLETQKDEIVFIPHVALLKSEIVKPKKKIK